jgi:hypothetical protein
MTTKDELGGVTITVKTELSTIGPAMTDGPQHGFAAEFVKPIGSIN